MCILKSVVANASKNRLHTATVLVLFVRNDCAYWLHWSWIVFVLVPRQHISSRSTARLRENGWKKYSERRDGSKRTCLVRKHSHYWNHIDHLQPLISFWKPQRKPLANAGPAKISKVRKNVLRAYSTSVQFQVQVPSSKARSDESLPCRCCDPSIKPSTYFSIHTSQSVRLLPARHC